MDLPTHLNRDEAIKWAIRQAQRIAAGEFNNEPMGVFKAAQRMEVLLTQHAWTDSDFPREVIPFAVGWNVSGSETDDEIRRAAAALAAVHR